MKRTLSALALSALTLSSSALAADTYDVDPGHTTVIFAAKHLGVSYTYGRFNDVSGSLVLGDKASDVKVDLTIKTESIDSGVEKRDQHLRNPDFFNAKQFPVITFKSTSVKQKDADTWAVTGDLSLHGVTKSLTIDVDKVGEGDDPWGGYRAGVHSAFTVQRSDFGMNHMPGGVSDDIKLIVAVEGVRK